MIRLLVIFFAFLLLARALRTAVATIGSTDRQAPSVKRSPSWDPWAVLGVARGADREEIVHAYREQLKLYHPDRVAELGPELQKVAHDKTVELQRAYTELTR